VLGLIRPPLHIPRATLDPIRGPLDALGVMTLALRRPLARELVAIACDGRHRGMNLSRFTINGDTTALLIEAIDRMIGCCSLVNGSPNVVIGVSEPEPTMSSTRLADFDAARARCHRAGISVREWVVVTRGGASHARAQ
jgi:hypothetical protein